MCELQSSMGEMAKKKNLIYLQNIIECLKFLIGHPCIITKFMNLFIYFIKISIKFIIKSILMNNNENNKKSINFKQPLYLS